MINITLVRMGMDFYDEDDKQASDMQNYRLRPRLSSSTSSVNDWYLKDKHGHYIAGDFMFLCADRLNVDFTDYGTDMKDSKRYNRNVFDDEDVAPTLANIKIWLEDALGEEVSLHLEEK